MANGEAEPVEHECAPPFARLGIVGTGLIGGSIALAARRQWPAIQIVGTPSRGGALPVGMLDRTMSDVGAIAMTSDLVVLAVPVTVVPQMMQTIAGSGTTALVSDVGSTKRGVMAAARASNLPSFLGGHPMAGGERPGAGEARADLFVGRPWLLVEGSADPAAAARFEMFVRALGAVTHWMSAEVHDRTVAYVSHLPQLVAAALMNAADSGVAATGPHVAGNAFTEMTRLASSPADLWEGICAENADFIAEALDVFLTRLPAATDLVDGRWVQSALSTSGAARLRWRAARRSPDGER